MPPGEPALIRLFWDNLCITVPVAVAITLVALYAVRTVRRNRQA